MEQKKIGEIPKCCGEEVEIKLITGWIGKCKKCGSKAFLPNKSIKDL